MWHAEKKEEEKGFWRLQQRRLLQENLQRREINQLWDWGYLFFMPDAISKSSSVLSRQQEALMENKKALDASKFYQGWGRRKKA